MVLTNGQTYFFIFCQAAVACFAINLIFNAYRMYMMSAGPCRALRSEAKRLEKEIASVRRLALIAYNRTQKEEPKNAG